MPAEQLLAWAPPASPDLTFEVGGLDEANTLLAGRHYLGPIAPPFDFVIVGWRAGRAVAAMVWSRPTSRRLPADGSWLELSRWLLTPEAGRNAGSRMHAWLVRWLRSTRPTVTTLVSYSDRSAGHTGALYRACNWVWRPTWHRLRVPPTRGGSWDGGATVQEPKDRWVFYLRPDSRREALLQITDQAALRRIEEARP